MESWSRWQDWAIVAVGACMVCVPLFTRDSPGGGTVWSAELLGAAVIVVAIWALASPEQKLPEITQVVLALLLILAPWIFGYTEYSGASTSAYVAGVVVLALAVWAASEIGKRADDRLSSRAARS